jgi:pimeloyl-ACP methyl ester carboxylesterase
MKKIIINKLSLFFPNYFANKLYNSLLNPQQKKKRQIEIETLANANKETISINGNKIQCYKWGNNEDSVLLIHGWEGNAGNYSEIVLKLLENNYSVYAFDGPGHGQSSGGKNVMFEYLDTVQHFISKWDIKKIISHSFGSVVTTYALSLIPNHTIDKYILLTTPHTFKDYVGNISNKIGFHQRTINSFIKKIEKERNQSIDEMDVVKYINNNSVKEALILHDIKDRIIPISQARIVADAWSKSNLLEIENTGHFKILRSKSVHETIINFLNTNPGS